MWQLVDKFNGDVARHKYHSQNLTIVFTMIIILVDDQNRRGQTITTIALVAKNGCCYARCLQNDHVRMSRDATLRVEEGVCVADAVLPNTLALRDW